MRPDGDTARYMQRHDERLDRYIFDIYILWVYLLLISPNSTLDPAFNPHHESYTA